MKRTRLIGLGLVLTVACHSDKSTSPGTPETPTPISVRFCLKGGWFAYQNSGADWQFATMASDTITFNATESLSIAYSFDPTYTEVWSLDREELLELSGTPRFYCVDAQTPSNKRLFANVAGIAPNESFSLATTNAAIGGSSSGGTFQFLVPAGPLDFVGIVNEDPEHTIGNRVIVRRQVNLPDSATMPTFDFNSSEMRGLKTMESFLSPLNVGTNYVQTSSFITGGIFTRLNVSTPSFGSGAAWEVPTDVMLPGDINEYSFAECQSFCSRSVKMSFRALSTFPVLSLGPVPSATDQVTTHSTPCTRLSWTTPAQGSYPKFASATVTWGANAANTFRMTLTAGFTHQPPTDAWRFEVPSFTRPGGACLIPGNQTPAGTVTVGESLNVFTGKPGVDGLVVHTATSTINVH